jgi:hypothetical protein
MKLTHMLQIRIPLAMDRALESLARARRLRGGKKSDVAREAIEAYLEVQRAKGAK